MVWDFSRYNVVVKQVEGVSDTLRDVEKRIRDQVGDDPVANHLLRNVRLAIEDLDARALTMLSAYDPVAHAMLEAGVKYDERRDMFGESFRAREAAAAARGIEGQRKRPGIVERFRRRRRARRLPGGSHDAS